MSKVLNGLEDAAAPGCTSWVQREKETLGAQVPINGIELAIARCKELEKPTRSTSVAGKKLLAFMLILLWWSGF